MSCRPIKTSGNVLVFHLTGQLRKSELDQIQKTALSQIQQKGKARFLLILEGFQGWDKSDNWEDVSFLNNDRYIEKIAFVGEKNWEDPVSAFVDKGLRPIEIRYFLPKESALAKAWIGLKPDQALE